jgi:hypothetical protein
VVLHLLRNEPEQPAEIWIEPPGAGYGFILDELEPLVGQGAHGVVEGARDLDAWIEIQDGETVGVRENRRRLATRPSEHATAVPALAPPLAELLDLVRDPAPSDLLMRAVARAALAVSRWAAHRGAPNTALTFAQLAQEADAETGAPDPRFALEVGRSALAVAEFYDAGMEWLHWAAHEAARQRYWAVAAEAWTVLAALEAFPPFPGSGSRHFGRPPPQAH